MSRKWNATTKRDWQARLAIRKRLLELLGKSPVKALSDRLGDTSRTRAHKLVNPAADGSEGQSITWALIEDLALAFNMTPAEFLAPILLAKSAQGYVGAGTSPDEAHQKVQHDVMALQDALLKKELAGLRRPEVARLLQWTAQAARHMTDPELIYESERLADFYTRRFKKSREGVLPPPQIKKERTRHGKAK